MQSLRCPVIVLAGGKSTRFGRDKASAVLAGRTLLQRVVDACNEVASRYVVVTAQRQVLPEVETRVLVTVAEDAFAEAGPLGGIYTGLTSLQSQAKDVRGHALVVACDMPLLQPALLRELLTRIEGHDAVAPLRDGLPEPLCAVYATACAKPARRLLERGAYKVAGLFDHVEALMIPELEWRRFDPEGLSFLNVNRREDFDAVSVLIDAG
jgi:molybdopterin-guanine dinucleotide biosynthesis protein A